MKKGDDTMWLALAIIGMIAIGIGSTYYFGEDNPIEESLEIESEQLAEAMFHVPSGTFKPEFEALFECTEKNPDGSFHCVEKKD